jgi:hypothetical protein
VVRLSINFTDSVWAFRAVPLIFDFTIATSDEITLQKAELALNLETANALLVQRSLLP